MDSNQPASSTHTTLPASSCSTASRHAGAWDVDHFDVRDDRLQVYGSIREDQTARFVYTIRATTAGTFSVPPSELVSLYLSDRWARIGGDSVTVTRR